MIYNTDPTPIKKNPTHVNQPKVDLNIHTSGRNLFLRFNNAMSFPLPSFEVSLYNSRGALVMRPTENVTAHRKGSSIVIPITPSMSTGIYLAKVAFGEIYQCKKIVIK